MEFKPLCTSQMPPRTDRHEDEESSSLSDYDSEWTQVSGAEDDSDFPPLTAVSDRPLSRADTLDGSVDGDIWEGFIDGLHRASSQSSEQMCPLDANIDIDATVETLPPHETQPAYVSAVPETEDHDSVNEALDSELIGTLKASRARSASSLHTSLTESQSKLRLSFPDPLSSRQDLDGDGAPQEGPAPSESGKEHYENSAAEDAPFIFEEVHALLTPSDSEAPGEIESVTLPPAPSATCALALFLYGSGSSSKWQIAERIMKPVLRRTDGASSTVEDGSERNYYFKHFSLLGDTANAENEPMFFVRVLDRTSNSSEVETPDVDEHVPSVAILLLPSRLPAVLPRHKYYLPLISASSLDFGSKSPVISSTFSEQVVVDSAHYTWKKLDLPTEDVIVLDQQRPHAILDATALESIDPDVLDQAFSMVLNHTKEGISSKTHDQLRLSTNRWKAFTVIAAAVIALAAAGGVQVYRNSSLMSVAVNSTSTGGTDGPTTVLDSVRTVAAFVVPASHVIETTRSLPRTLATTVAKTTMYSTPGPRDGGSEPSKLAMVAPDVTPSRSSLTESSPPKPSTCHSRARSWVDKFNLSLGEYIPRDLIVWPVDTLGIVGKKAALIPKPVRSLSSDKTPGNIVKSLSLRTVQNSLAVVSLKGKALKAMAGKDLSILYEAVDELVRSLHQQGDNAKGEMKGTKSVTQSGFSVRNARAKENARRLRRAGEHFFQAAGNCLRNKGEAIRAASQSRHSRRRRGKFMREQRATSAEDNKAAKKEEHGRSVKPRQYRVHRASE